MKIISSIEIFLTDAQQGRRVKNHLFDAAAH